MEPFKALSLITAAAVVSLVGAGAGGFYFGYKQARGDLEEIKAHLSSATASVAVPAADGQSVVTLNMTPLLEEVRALSKDVAAVRDAVGGPQQVAMPDYSDEFNSIRDEIKTVAATATAEPQASPAVVDAIRTLTASIQESGPQLRQAVSEEIRALAAALQSAEPRAPQALLDEVRALSAAVTSLETNTAKPMIEELRYLGDQIQAGGGAQPAAGGGGSTTQRSKSDPRIGNEIAQLRQLIASATDQFGKCQTQLATFTTAALQPQAAAAAATASRQGPANVVLYDNVVLKRDEEKLYDDLGLSLSLQGIAARQVKVAVNRQGFGLAFGERKVFRHQNVECELNLMETNLNDGEARVSIACKR